MIWIIRGMITLTYFVALLCLILCGWMIASGDPVGWAFGAFVMLFAGSLIRRARRSWRGRFVER